MPRRELINQANENELFILFWRVGQTRIQHGVAKCLQLFFLMIANRDLRRLHRHSDEDVIGSECLGS